MILAEGPSEEVVIPKFASAFGLEIDQSFVCVVPLGGRHVNHFWKLLKDLQIPFVTLLDLDIGRQTGGWARIKYVCDQLLAHDVSIDEILSAESDELPHVTAIDDLESLHLNRSIDLDEFKIWAKTLEHFNVYFSGPLDLDFTMLWTYPDAYKHFEGQTGPSIPDEGSDDWRPYMVKAIASIVGDNKEIVDMYLGLDRDVVEGFPWYRYLFSNRSKPVSHMIATARINDQELAKKVPGSLNRLVSRCKTLLAEAS